MWLSSSARSTQIVVTLFAPVRHFAHMMMNYGIHMNIVRRLNPTKRYIFHKLFLLPSSFVVSIFLLRWRKSSREIPFREVNLIQFSNLKDPPSGPHHAQRTEHTHTHPHTHMAIVCSRSLRHSLVLPSTVDAARMYVVSAGEFTRNITKDNRNLWGRVDGRTIKKEFVIDAVEFIPHSLAKSMRTHFLF